MLSRTVLVSVTDERVCGKIKCAKILCDAEQDRSHECDRRKSVWQNKVCQDFV